MNDNILFQIMIFLLSAMIMVPIAKRLGLGSVLGYLIAGILIGPAVLDVTGVESHQLLEIAELGVVMMLFIIGLDLEPSHIWNMRKMIFGLGGLQLLLTAALTGLLLFLAGENWPQAVVLGLITSCSSTALGVQYLNEKRLNHTPAGERAFSVLIFQDIMVIPILAVLPLLKNVQTEQAASDASLVFPNTLPAFQHGLLVIGSIALVILFGRFGIRAVFKIIARTKLREMFTVTALLIIVAIALLMHLIGLSPALGALLAGIVLANSEYRHELEGAIDPFKSLLLGLFFMAVGAAIDFDFIGTKPFLMAFLVAIMILSKFSVLVVLGRSFGLKIRDNLIFSIALCQGGEFGFVLLSFSLHEGILNKEVTDIAMAVTAISMSITPILLALNERFVLPHLISKEKPNDKPSDVQQEQNQIIIAGYGSFGNTLGRFLNANKVNTTVLDFNPDNVDLLRRVGLKVYYGDATRYELLEIAGASTARMIVVAMGDAKTRLQVIDVVKKHFPNLKILCRASNKYDAFDILETGVTDIYRQTIDTSLRLGKDILKSLNHRHDLVERSAEAFFNYDEMVVRQLSYLRHSAGYIEAARQTLLELEFIMDEKVQDAFKDSNHRERHIG
ncbi:monovalent cation:proton antiporter-2 (CPA2) family protein [Cesiribacter sp. SM1]|uniref:monovalent cation:proton antiporter-2 (CPA2) family protein n=1 Tax=Cesiribacter sp. SM1 TaxID=2861196 RepID=UPI001CD341B2|nr:monovalent cation:proton antiporter-2 (CPA2) family protein [Cesiribacter sp. SM1]